MVYRKGKQEYIYFDKEKESDKWILYQDTLYSKEPMNEKELYKAIKIKPEEVSTVPKIINMLKKERDELLSKYDVYIKQPKRVKIYDYGVPEKVVSEIQQYGKTEIKKLKIEKQNLLTEGLNNRDKKRLLKLSDKSQLNNKERKEHDKLCLKRTPPNKLWYKKLKEITHKKDDLEDKYYYVIEVYPSTLKPMPGMHGRKVSMDKIEEDRKLSRKRPT